VQTFTVLFAELVGASQRPSGIDTDAFRPKFFAELATVVEEANGEVVEKLDHGCVAVFRDAAANAVSCATAMHVRMAALEKREPVRLRIGISTGDGDGTSVVAERLCAAAAPAQTLVSEELRAEAGGRTDVHFRSLGTMVLRGVVGPVAVAEVATGPVSTMHHLAWRQRGGVERRVLIGFALIIAAVLIASALRSLST
jgi:class 3 adenylate cyclase